MTEEQVLERLRASGHRLTGPRRALVDILLRADAPLTADEIYRRARAARAGANLSTVYRNLATFCAIGWLDTLPGANGERHYQVHRAQEQALSVLCLDCGELTSLKAPPAGLHEAVRGMGFSAQSLRVTMSAHCEHICPRKEK